MQGCIKYIWEKKGCNENTIYNFKKSLYISNIRGVRYSFSHSILLLGPLHVHRIIEEIKMQSRKQCIEKKSHVKIGY